ncbi:lamin tail domain-containing protein [Polyangium mundeleinium]|uniref:Lamin tail domain-containing protein n=1 Tax=Polyangium mundeleinium TaxID=2995306 RepID=A0ABT5F4G0_9BACT|nr:lamin tail domain-containing protein [Polyangium mundeleinium]MDC0748293.1 lamin tail domain-containing protein [Polyangium mundeleinium]
MKLRSLSVAGVLAALAVGVAGCSDEPTQNTTTSSSSSGTGGQGGDGGGGTGGVGGDGGMGGGGMGGGGMGGGGMGGTGGVGGMGGTGGMGGSGGGNPPTEICNNMMDDDGDGDVDCSDADCAAACAEACTGGADEDNDGDIDCADADCALAPACGKLVINEIDYDQASADTAEFIEIYNAGGDVMLDGVEVILVNGTGPAGADVVYGTPSKLSGLLAAGGYVVVASTGVTNIDPAAIVVSLPNPMDNIQNGAPDGVALFDTKTNTLLDGLSYENGTPDGQVTAVMLGGQTFSLVSGTPTTASDNQAAASPIRSMIRYPNGQDTSDDSVDWRATTQITPGAANVATAEVCDTAMLDEDADNLIDCADPDCAMAPQCTESCTNMKDDDGDMMIDCADPDCAADPACLPQENCSNGTDDDGDMAIDCADTDCADKSCGANGLVCEAASMTCACPSGMTMEMACADLVDDDCDGLVDCADTDCAGNMACVAQKVTAVDYQVIAHGGKLVVTGNGFTGATVVKIGGVDQTFTVDNNTQITLTNVPDTTPIALQDLIVTTPSGDTAPFQVTVIHLLINELDSDQMGTDSAEFVEITTGVPNVSLAGYTLVLYNGNNDLSYTPVTALSGTTDANGMLVVGSPGMTPAPTIAFSAASVIQNGQDAVAIYQAAPASFPSGTAVKANGLIDVLVYSTGQTADAGLLDVLIGPAGTPGRTQVSEGSGGVQETQSIQRCGDGRRNGDKFKVGQPTPGAANNVMACP